VRVLLDESLPRDLARAIAGHEVQTVQGVGWAGLTNGELLRAAAAAGFAALVTADRNLEHQQNVRAAGLGLVVLRARSNRLPDLLPLVPALLEALPRVQPGQVLHVGV
jgi:hypothetical protein